MQFNPAETQTTPSCSLNTFEVKTARVTSQMNTLMNTLTSFATRTVFFRNGGFAKDRIQGGNGAELLSVAEDLLRVHEELVCSGNDESAGEMFPTWELAASKLLMGMSSAGCDDAKSVSAIKTSSKRCVQSHSGSDEILRPIFVATDGANMQSFAFCCNS